MWTNIRTEIIPRISAFKKMLDIVALLIILGYYVFSFQLAEYIVRTYQLPPVSALFLLLEQTRMLMKVHAFIRSNAPKILKYDNESDVKLNCPALIILYFSHLCQLSSTKTNIQEHRRLNGGE
ncbi:hypothetical protein WA026_022532 [Henosepilachna vigintioctopunctata]|uniref:Uncharacterized protein n=1 Tax=Henosepilachna vigintioctopunctata TaxID=420089 RepID=A0AAW1URS9_9CUCU